MRLRYTGAVEPRLGLSRISNSCVYASRGGVSHLSIYGLGSEVAVDHLQQFSLRGGNNAYDEKIELLGRCFDRNAGEILAIGFHEAAENGWFEEQFNDRQVRWLTTRDPMLKLSDMSPKDFMLIGEARLSPGFQGR